MNRAAGDGFGSRKFIVTMTGMFLGTLVIVLAMFLSPEPEFYNALGGFFIMLAAGKGAYQWANVRHHQSEGIENAVD